jgi:hypothetical protein
VTTEELEEHLRSLSHVGGVYEFVRQAVDVMNRERVTRDDSRPDNGLSVGVAEST